MDAILLSTGSDPAAKRDLLGIVDDVAGKYPNKPIIVISDHSDAVAWEAVRHGVRGYIPTTLDHAMAAAALDVVLAGGYFVPANMLIDRARSAGSERPDAQIPERPAARNGSDLAHVHALERTAPRLAGALTCRESEILARIQEGKPNQVIAFELKIRESTVKVHVGHLMRKLNASNRTQLAIRVPIGPPQPSE